MEKIKIELAKIMGTPCANLWSQVHTFIPEDPQKLSQRGKLLAVIGLKSQGSEVEIIAQGREILARFHEEYFGNLEGGILERLKTSLEKIRSEWPQTAITAGVIFSQKDLNVIYLGILGEGKAVIKRGNLLTNLLEGTTGGEIETGSGLVEAGDVILLGSNVFFEIVSEGVLRASLNLGNPQEMIESLAPIVLARSDLGQAAAVVCLLEKEESLEEIPTFVPEGLPEKETVTSQKSNLKDLFLTKLRTVKTIFTKVPRPKIRLRLPKFREKPFYVRREKLNKKNNKVVFSIILILAFLLLGSIFLGMFKKKNQEKEAKLKEFFSQAEGKFNEAKQIIYQDEVTASRLLAESEDLLKQARKLKPKETEDISFLENEIAKLLLKTKKEFSLKDIPIFFDLSLLAPKTKAFDLACFGKQLAILDKEKGSVYLVDLEKKSSEVLIDEKLRKAQKIKLADNWIYVLTEEGIIRSDITERKFSIVTSLSESWGKIVDLGSFGGNLYLLDQDKKTIWQIPKTEAGFGQSRIWLAPETVIKNQPESMAIDGSIWMLEKEGKILKFSRGKEEKFELKGYQGDLEKIKAFYLSFEEKYLYLLNPEEKKVIIFGKDGQFKVQYQWTGGPDQPEFFFVLESLKKVFLVKENLIYTLSIEEILE